MFRLLVWRKERKLEKQQRDCELLHYEQSVRCLVDQVSDKAWAEKTCLRQVNDMSLTCLRPAQNLTQTFNSLVWTRPTLFNLAQFVA